MRTVCMGAFKLVLCMCTAVDNMISFSVLRYFELFCVHVDQLYLFWEWITVLYEPAKSATAVTIVDHGVRVVTFMPLS